MTGLEPCPFCGGDAEIRSGSSTKPYVRCKLCGCRTGSHAWGREEDAVEAWNTRCERTCLRSYLPSGCRIRDSEEITKCLLTVDDESIADGNALRRVVQTARFNGFEVREYEGLTCHMDSVPTGEEPGVYHCDRCHAENSGIWCEDGGTSEPLYCPYCGSEVVER